LAAKDVINFGISKSPAAIVWLFPRGNNTNTCGEYDQL
jgi:hypothetical protein